MRLLSVSVVTLALVVAAGCGRLAVEATVEIDRSLPVEKRVALARSATTDERLRRLRAELSEAFPAHIHELNGLYLKWKVAEARSLTNGDASTKVSVIVGIVSGLDRGEAMRLVSSSVERLRGQLSAASRSATKPGV